MEYKIFFTYIILLLCYIITCVILGIILKNQNKLKKDIENIKKDITDINCNYNTVYKHINKCESNIKQIYDSLYEETNFIKDKLGIIIRNTNNIRDNVQVVKHNTATILNKIETKNKAKISYTPNELRKSSNQNKNGQEKLKTAKNNENQHDNVRKYEKD